MARPYTSTERREDLERALMDAERELVEMALRVAKAEKDRLWVNSERTVLVRLWHTGQVEVATRDATWETWGPPVYLTEEKP